MNEREPERRPRNRTPISKAMVVLQWIFDHIDPAIENYQKYARLPALLFLLALGVFCVWIFSDTNGLVG